jgi:hypothetical protein
LRGSHETALLDAGVPVHVVAARCGHDPAVLLRSYAKRTKKADTSAAAVIGTLSKGVLGWVNGMAFSNCSWAQITIHSVVLEFLRGERASYPPLASLLDSPNLQDSRENYERLKILYARRAPFMVEIPADTSWWDVSALRESDLSDLCVFGSTQQNLGRCG